MHIRELIERTGIVERQVRYLVAEGFIPSPRGGRSNADYGEDHVDAIRRYMRLRELGFPPAAIRVLLKSKQGAPFPVAPGITIVVDPELLASGADVEPILVQLKTILTDLFQESAHAGRRNKKQHRPS